MAGAINLSGGGHWYAKDGAAQHDADLRVARKKLLYRSVTSIDKDMFKNERLEVYKLEQLAEAAFNNPRQPHESVDDYSKRIFEESLARSIEAAAFGIRIHNAVDKIELPPSDDVAPFVAKVKEWFDQNVVSTLWSEKTILDHEIGCAGRGDRKIIHRVHGPCTIDFKTQGVRVDKKGKKTPGFYDSFARQLGFYEAAEAKQEGRYPKLDRCLSVVIDSKEPSAPYEKLWEPEEILSAYEDFVIAVWRWHKSKDYWPNGRWDLCEKLKQIPL